MGAQSTFTALTENRGGTAPAGSHLYVGIDVGRRHHVVAAIVQERMENGSWERAGAHRIPTNGQGFRELIAWLHAYSGVFDQSFRSIRSPLCRRPRERPTRGLPQPLMVTSLFEICA